MSFLTLPRIAHADETVVFDATESHAAETGTSQQNKERKVTAATLLLVGIAVVGIFLVAIVMLWGARIRRVARARLPKQKAMDELWYLKPKKELPPSTSSDMTSPDTNTSEPQDGDNE